MTDSAKVITRARRRAAAYDSAQIVLLAGMDWLFVRWPSAQVPIVGRDLSVLVVAALNALYVTHVIVSRTFPRWSAGRIARTWCLSERARFFSERRRQQAS